MDGVLGSRIPYHFIPICVILCHPFHLCSMALGGTDIELSHLTALDTVALRAAIAILAATIGGLFAVGRGQISHRLLCGLVSFAAGSLLAVTSANIIPEAAEMTGPLLATLALVGGMGIFAGIGRYVSVLCPACAASASEKGYLRLGILLMVAMGVHSTVDGLAIGAGSAASDSNVGTMILIAVSYHKIPEGLALVSIARLAGYGRWKALGVTALIEFTTALGALAGLVFVPGESPLILGITLGLVAGSFLYTVGFALLKEMYAHEKGSILVYVTLGFFSMLAIGALFAQFGLGHTH